MKLVNEAWDTLSNPEKRARYDAARDLLKTHNVPTGRTHTFKPTGSRPVVSDLDNLEALLASHSGLWWGCTIEHGWVVMDKRDIRNSYDRRLLVRCRDWTPIAVSGARFLSNEFFYYKNYIESLRDGESDAEACGELVSFVREFATRRKDIQETDAYLERTSSNPQPTRRNGPQRTHPSATPPKPQTHPAVGNCPRCGGSGKIPHFSHVSGGVCFRCNGSGWSPSATQQRRPPSYSATNGENASKPVARTGCLILLCSASVILAAAVRLI